MYTLNKWVLNFHLDLSLWLQVWRCKLMTCVDRNREQRQDWFVHMIAFLQIFCHSTCDDLTKSLSQNHSRPWYRPVRHIGGALVSMTAYCVHVEKSSEISGFTTISSIIHTKRHLCWAFMTRESKSVTSSETFIESKSWLQLQMIL